METIVVKATDFSLNDIKYMQSGESKDVCIALVYTDGSSSKFKATKTLFFERVESESSIIYK